MVISGPVDPPFMAFIKPKCFKNIRKYLGTFIIPKCFKNPPALQGHQAVRRISEPSFYRLDDLSLKTDGWYLYECCFPAPWNGTVTLPDVHCLNSGVPPGSNPALWNRTVTLPDVHCLNSGVPPGHPCKSINFQASLQGNRGHENWSQGHPKS